MVEFYLDVCIDIWDTLGCELNSSKQCLYISLDMACVQSNDNHVYNYELIRVCG